MTSASRGTRLYDDQQAYADNLILHNSRLFHHLKQRCCHGEKTLMIGSARQDSPLDRANGRKIVHDLSLTLGSAPVIMAHLLSHLNSGLEEPDFHLDKMLLGAVFQGQEHAGYYDAAQATSAEFFQSAAKSIYDLNPIPPVETVQDEAKFLILYAQMHHHASKHMDKEVHYEFFDDRMDILEGLAQLFEAHPEFIPPNVTLTLTQYNGTPTVQRELKGDASSLFDVDFATTLKAIAAAYCPAEDKTDDQARNIAIVQTKLYNLNIAKNPEPMLATLQARREQHASSLAQPSSFSFFKAQETMDFAATQTLNKHFRFNLEFGQP